MTLAEEESPAEAATGTDALDNPALTKVYLSFRADYRELIRRAEKISRGTGGRKSTGKRMYWGSILFTRIVVTAKSVGLLLPDPKPGSHWDFSAAASLARTHTGPLSFYRMEDHDRGTGVETRHEKRYMLMVIQFAGDFLARAIETQLDIVPDAETRKPNQTVQQITASVERNQGRLREKRSRSADQ